MSWKVLRLNEIGDIVTGNTPSKTNSEFYGGEVPFVSPAELGHGKIVRAKQTLTQLGAKSARVLPKNSVLICCIGSLGKVGLAGVDLATNQQINSIIVNERVAYYKYVYYYCLTLKKRLESIAPATTVAIVNKSKFGDLKIPLPSLATQKQIAAVLEKADNLRQQSQQMEREFNLLAQSVFLDMFGDVVSNEKRWNLFKFGEVCSAQLGKMLSAKAKVGESPKKYLRNANVRWRRIDTDNLLEMDFNEKEQKKFSLQLGDLLVCEGGEVGRCAIWENQVSECYYQKALHRVRVDNNLLTPEYVQEYLYWMAKLGGLSASVSEVTFSHLTAEKLAKLSIPVPPMKLQKKFVQIVNAVTQNMSDCLAERGYYDELFNSLMQRAFKGELDLKDVA
ncbi:restriction endonuclease subunit S [Alteromonas sp.]|uniref:restriction endonuclease subunit S n=1 Tax=Alteromonas sp. TaxID=232 RepID=UPI00257F4BE8|nr:restriction endonuclease subunit S [Alteromonas sp.]NQY18098.1 restriction endonuclease subunit S [Alteromonas sp.]